MRPRPERPMSVPLPLPQPPRRTRARAARAPARRANRRGLRRSAATRGTRLRTRAARRDRATCGRAPAHAERVVVQRRQPLVDVHRRKRIGDDVRKAEHEPVHVGLLAQQREAKQRRVVEREHVRRARGDPRVGVGGVQRRRRPRVAVERDRHAVVHVPHHAGVAHPERAAASFVMLVDERIQRAPQRVAIQRTRQAVDERGRVGRRVRIELPLEPEAVLIG